MILYESPERVLLLLRSKSNRKTGPVPTLWGFVPHVTPREAVNIGMDSAVCLDCQHRLGGDAMRCYTHKGQTLTGLAAIVKKYNRGGYPRSTKDKDIEDFLRGERVQGARAVRSMGYGDMGAFPPHIWQEIDVARQTVDMSVLGYTQQWRKAHWLRDTHMASVTTAFQAAEAEALGWRTFWSVKAGTEPGLGRLNCPASKEQGHVTTCNQCRLCYGASSKAPSVWIREH
jgi:hypothetical protein